MSAQQRRFTRLPRVVGLAAAAASPAMLVAGCTDPGTGSGDSRYGFPTVEQDADAPITVWVDADRAKIAEAFAADNPDITVNIETYDGNSRGTNSFQTKISLADAAGEGWPDVVWSGQVNDASWAAHEQNGVQAHVQPDQCRVVDDQPSPAGARDPHFGRAGRDRLPVLAALPGNRADGGCHEGVARF